MTDGVGGPAGGSACLSGIGCKFNVWEFGLYGFGQGSNLQFFPLIRIRTDQGYVFSADGTSPSG